MSKHTPGPWEWGCGYIDTTVEGDYIIIAELHSTFGPDNYGVDQWMLEDEEYESNGRLIAAAPEMLELLREIRNSDILPPCRRDAIDALLDKIEGGGK